MIGTETVIRPLQQEDRAEWEVLWKGYLTFYKSALPPEMFDLTWARFHDPAEPVHVLGAFIDGRMEGIVHYIFHRSCWTKGDYCYLQDLFTRQGARGHGVGRKLIASVQEAAEKVSKQADIVIKDLQDTIKDVRTTLKRINEGALSEDAVTDLKETFKHLNSLITRLDEKTLG